MEQNEAGAIIMGKVGSVATYGGSAVTVASSMDTIFGLTSSEWSVVGVIGGLAIALLGFFVNIYFKRQHLLIAQRNSRPDEDG